MAGAGMVVAGAGKAAASAIVGLREHGWTGPITLIGEEMIAPYDRPPLSKEAISGGQEPEPVFILDASILSSLDVTFLAGSPAVAIDRAEKIVVTGDGRRVSYEKLLIATGARARKLPLNGGEKLLTLRDFPDATALRDAFLPGRPIAIIGGGFIGLELAASASKRGSSVTVIEAQPRIMMRGVPESIAHRMAERHASAGVNVITRASVERIEDGAIVLGGGQRIAAEIAVAGVGAVPETSLAQSAGLKTDNGIACDHEMRTSDPDIFAAGDCCSFPHVLYDNRRIRLEAWRSAQEQGAVAAQNMLGGRVRYEAVPWFWSDQYELTLQIAGLPIEQGTTVRRPLRDGAFIEFQLDTNGQLVCASGIGRSNFIARDVRMGEMLIGRRASPEPEVLADPTANLKALLAA
jgi:3-phenylpropionate/trans-cinnamate dioxygenase ferredoxin reductase subunit